MSTRRVIAAALACAAAFSCSSDPTSPDPPEGLDLQVTAAEFVVGGTSVGVLTNRREAEAFYDFCRSALQIRRGSEWVTLEPLRLCPGGYAAIDPGAVVTAPVPLEQAGTLRLRLPVRASRRGAASFLFSQVFGVAAR